MIGRVNEAYKVSFTDGRLLVVYYGLVGKASIKSPSKAASKLRRKGGFCHIPFTDQAIEEMKAQCISMEYSIQGKK